ncbi:hypothetical protein [Aquipseudomonas alcaligenes]|uniref:hypothetical protein n=1 Tax=Aquipseudomonas alcaligenes TaxID=43263 RepID=UPI0037489D75
MSNTDKELWIDIESKLNALFQAHKNCLSEESIEAVQHYLDHSEYEIALEGLIIDLMEQGVHYEGAWRQLGIALGLNKETVLLPDFWDKLTKYQNKQI